MGTSSRSGRKALAFGAAAAAVAIWADRAEAGLPDCRGVASLRLAHTTLNVLEAAPGRALEGPPSSCRVRGVIRPARDARIGFELWFPRSAWNGRLLMLGNG